MTQPDDDGFKPMAVTFHTSEVEGETMVWMRFRLAPGADPAMIETADYLTADNALLLTLHYDIDTTDAIEVDIGAMDAVIAAYHAFLAAQEPTP